jgi:hypothetical protein
MSTALSITATTNASQTSIIIKDYTGISRTAWTPIILYFSNEVDPTLNRVYQLDTYEEQTFVEDGLVEVLFSKENFFGTTYIPDGWWTIQLKAAVNDFVSNIYGFMVYQGIKFNVFSRASSVHVPETDKGRVEDLFRLVLLLDRLPMLDTSYIVDREIKSTRTLNALNKLLGV